MFDYDDGDIFIYFFHGIYHGEKMITTKVDKMGRTVIPSPIRKMLNIKEGDYVEWIVDDDKVFVRKRLVIDREAIKRRFNELRKSAPKCFTEKEREEEDKWGLREWALAKLGL